MYMCCYARWRSLFTSCPWTPTPPWSPPSPCGLSGILMCLFVGPNLEDILNAAVPILYAGIMSCGVAYTLQIIGQKYTRPTIASLIMSLESVFAVLAGIVVLREIPTARETMGCVLMFLAIIIAQLPSRREQAQ